MTAFKLSQRCRPGAGHLVGIDDRGGETAVADRHGLIDRQRVEAFLLKAQTPQSLCTHLDGLGDEDAKVQLGQSDGTDGKEHHAMIHAT